MKAWKAGVLILSLAGRTLLAQEVTPAVPVSTGPDSDRPALTISVNVVERTARAINYRHRGGSTTIDFKGTQQLPAARGEAKVESKQGYIEIEVEFDNLQAASRFGPEYLTYVMWAITPEGRATNLGEILLNGTKSKLNVTTELQSFGLVVTAEPYFSVTRPSVLIVMENVVRKDTVGKVEEIEAKYELFERGQYQRLANPTGLAIDPKVPLELYEARNAVNIARSMGAARYASETFVKAEKGLAQAEAYQARKAGVKPVTMTARAAVQTAEDARAIAVKRQEEELLATERKDSADREQSALTARAAAQSETDRVTRDAELARVKAQAAADRLTQDMKAQADAATAEANRLKVENDTRAAIAALEAERNKVANDARIAAAALEAERLKLEADRLKRENEAQ